MSQSKPKISKGKHFSISFICSTTPIAPLFQTALFSVQPEHISVIVKLHTKSPIREVPQCATVSASKKPGIASSH
ncbi:MAG: hypothetical protein EBZ04_11200 [Betaproteobacteria bacterium]|nr:hypothetical protein [Betaproteobacteria bacterium]